MRAQTVVCALSKLPGCSYTINRIDQDGHWQQLVTQPILISAPQWLHKPCNGPTQLYRVGKKSFVKAGMAMYSHVVDFSGQWISVSLILGCKLGFSPCAT